LAGQELVLIKESLQPKSAKELLEEELGPQLRLFCYEYLIDFDHRRAAVAAQRSSDSGIRLLRNPNISQYIKLLTDELVGESLISRDMVQYELLHRFLPKARGDEPIVGVDRDGVAWSGNVTNMSAYAKAIELMAKHSGFTLPEIVKGGLTINVNLKALGIDIEGQFKEIDDV